MTEINPADRSVLQFPGDAYPFDKGIELTEDVLKSVHGMLSYSDELLFQGINCELLQPGASSWKKGMMKVKVTLEFIPESDDEQTAVDLVAENSSDTDKSPLDDIRKMQHDTQWPPQDSGWEQD